MNHDLRFDFECMHEVRKRLAKEIQPIDIFKIAEVLALIGKTATRNSEDILQMAADGEQRRNVKRKRNSERHESAGTADELRSAIDHSHHGIIATLKNFP